MVDLMEGRVDVALRSGALRDSSLKARKILESRRVVIASPDYLAGHGIPETPADLARHNCLLFNFRQNPFEWPFRDPVTGEVAAQQVSGNFFGDNGPTLRQLCLEGLGLARLGEFHVAPDLAAGRLVRVLERYNPEDIELIHAIFADHQHLPARVRVFVDFLAERIRAGAVRRTVPAGEGRSVEVLGEILRGSLTLAPRMRSFSTMNLGRVPAAPGLEGC